MILIYIPGCWDLLHVGHLTILERARSLGDKLIVGVPSDDTVKEDKGEWPIVKLEHRLRMLNAFKCVDFAVPYYSLEFLTHLELFKPDILVVGDTWGSDIRHKRAENWIQRNDRRMVVMPYSSGVSTTMMRQRLHDLNRSQDID